MSRQCNRSYRKLLILPLLTILSLSGMLTACQKQLHPHAVNQFDSNSADDLVIYQAALGQAKANVKAGTWPATWLPAVNEAGAVYNTTVTAYHTWRDTYLGIKQGDPVALQNAFTNDLNQLADQIKALFAKAGQPVPGVKK